MWTIIIKKKFSSAHFLRGYKGKCEELHGHNYLIVVYIAGKKLRKSELLYDFKEIKDYLNKILPDHQYLNETYKFNPTTENLARYFYDIIKKKYPVTKVEVWEDENQGSSYTEK